MEENLFDDYSIGSQRVGDYEEFIPDRNYYTLSRDSVRNTFDWSEVYGY